MPRAVISTDRAPESPLFSQAVRGGPFLFLSGMTGTRRETGALAGDSIQDQTRQALTNCQAVLEAAGGTLDDVVEIGVLLTHSDDFAGMNEEYAAWFPTQPPARYVARLGVEVPGLRVSLRMTAYLG